MNLILQINFERNMAKKFKSNVSKNDEMYGRFLSSLV